MDLMELGSVSIAAAAAAATTVGTARWRMHRHTHTQIISSDDATQYIFTLDFAYFPFVYRTMQRSI